MNKTHCIGIEEVTMAAIAVALQKKGYAVTTSTIENKIPADLPADAELRQQKALNSPFQNNASEFDDQYSAVIVGRQVDKDHEQVMKFQQLGVPIYTYPAYLQEYAKDKQRIVAIGNDKILEKFFSILIHVMQYWKRAFDYATLLSEPTVAPAIHLSDAPIIFLQGDTVPFSPLDQRILTTIYQPHVVVMTDIPNSKDDAETYKNLQYIADAIPKAGRLIYNKDIADLCKIGSINRPDVENAPFQAQAYKISKTRIGFITTLQGDVPCSLMDTTSLQALSSVCAVLQGCAITHTQFYEAIQTYEQ